MYYVDVIHVKLYYISKEKNNNNTTTPTLKLITTFKYSILWNILIFTTIHLLCPIVEFLDKLY